MKSNIKPFLVYPVMLAALCSIMSCSLWNGEEDTRQIQAEKYKYAFYTGKEKNWLEEEEIRHYIASNKNNLQHDMIEVTAYAHEPVTSTQKAAAAQLRQDVINAMKKHNWFSYKQAAADGFAKIQGEDEVHYANKKYLRDGEILNPEKPEFLMFYPTKKGMLLTGVMFQMENHYDHGPQPGGNDTIWHYHWISETCWEFGVAVAHSFDGKCPEGTELHNRSPEMLHLWIAANPKGDYNSDMFIVSDTMLDDKLIMENADQDPVDPRLLETMEQFRKEHHQHDNHDQH